MLEKIGFYLDEEHEDIYRFLRTRDLSGEELSRRISEDLDLTRVLTRASKRWDGGYALAGLIGNGDAFVARDPSGIRPLLLFPERRGGGVRVRARAADDRVRLSLEQVKEVQPGHVVVIKKRGTVTSNAVHAAAAADVVLLRADLFFAGQRCRHLPRAEGARGRASRTR